MKKRLVLLLLATLMIFSGCGGKDDSDKPNVFGKPEGTSSVDYDHIIDNFVEDSFNHTTLAVGEADKPQAAIWLQNNAIGCTTYTSDPSVVTVTDLGKVEAVGPGTAYVIITANYGTMHDIHRYDVVGTAAEKNEKHSIVSVMPEKESETETMMNTPKIYMD